MIDRRSPTDHSSLSGTDYVLEGASVRDRFLTAFILRHNGPFKIPPHTARPPDSPSPSGMGAFFPGADEEERFSVRVESTCEPLTLRVIDERFGADGDDDM